MPMVKIVCKGAGGPPCGASYWQHWLTSTTGTSDDPEDIITAIAGRITSYLRPQMSELWSIGRFDWTYYPGFNAEPMPTQIVTPTAIIGVITGDPLPCRVTMMVEYKAFATKPNRKRIYVGRFAESQNTAPGVPNSAVVSAVQSYADNTLTEINVNGHAWFFGVGRINPANGQVTAFNQLTSHLVQTKWAYLRTRDANRGI